MSASYHCPHVAEPSAPLASSYASSSTSFFPLDQLFFCEECDAVRCDLCCVTEIAGYFCPNCTFDVPSANVRGDKNRCARNCFSCPECTTPLQVQATGTTEDAGPATPSGPPHLLVCPCCRWSSRQAGLEFEKSTGLASQLQKMQSGKDMALPEYEALKDHLEAYISAPAPAPTPARAGARQPTRHISQLTQMAARALHREVPGMAAASVRAARRDVKPGTERQGWDELGDYTAKNSWKSRSLEHGDGDVAYMRGLREPTKGNERSWYEDHTAQSVPQRIPLQTKLTKRCPHPGCRHLLIQPDTKSTRFKIKMVAGSYLPSVEVGRRRRLTGAVATDHAEAESRRKERRVARRRGEELDENLDVPLRAGHVVALTNPLYDTIQVRLTQHTSSSSGTNHLVHIPTPHFLVNPLKDAWAYDEDDDLDIEGTEAGMSEEGSVLASSKGTMGPGKRSRLSILNTTSAAGLKDRRKREGDVERKGNCSKAGIEVEILPGAEGKVVFDLEIRYTYRSDEADGSGVKDDKAGGGKRAKEEYKHFTFWVRLDLGCVSGGTDQ